MIQRFLQALWMLFNAYSYYKNPFQYVLSVVISALIPILFYVVGGAVAMVIFIIAMFGMVIYWIVKKVREDKVAT
jgi:type II secretory pathway component PulF